MMLTRHLITPARASTRVGFVFVFVSYLHKTVLCLFTNALLGNERKPECTNAALLRQSPYGCTYIVADGRNRYAYSLGRSVVSYGGAPRCPLFSLKGLQSVYQQHIFLICLRYQ